MLLFGTMNVVAFLFIREEWRFYVGALFLVLGAHPNFIHERIFRGVTYYTLLLACLNGSELAIIDPT
jgi:hypothetical protein